MLTNSHVVWEIASALQFSMRGDRNTLSAQTGAKLIFDEVSTDASAARVEDSVQMMMESLPVVDVRTQWPGRLRCPETEVHPGESPSFPSPSSNGRPRAALEGRLGARIIVVKRHRGATGVARPVRGWGFDPETT